MTRKGSARDDALSEEDFNRLIKTSERSDQPLENKFILLMAGRLGLRVGEIAHIKSGWFDFENKMLTIPKHEPCDCYYCKRRFKKRKKNKETDIIKEVKEEQWQPKTKHAPRSIPFGFNSELERISKKMMEKYGECPFSVGTINKKIVKLGKMVGLENVYPQALRSTAANKFAYDNVSPKTLQTIMGWGKLGMADVYIANSGIRAKKEFEKIYGINEIIFTNNQALRRVFFLTDICGKLIRRKRRKNEKDWLKNLLFSKKKRKPEQMKL